MGFLLKNLFVVASLTGAWSDCGELFNYHIQPLPWPRWSQRSTQAPASASTFEHIQPQMAIVQNESGNRGTNEDTLTGVDGPCPVSRRSEGKEGQRPGNRLFPAQRFKHAT